LRRNGSAPIPPVPSPAASKPKTERLVREIPANQRVDHSNRYIAKETPRRSDTGCGRLKDDRRFHTTGIPTAEAVPNSLAAHAQPRGFLQSLARFLLVPFSSNDVNLTRAKSSAISLILLYLLSVRRLSPLSPRLPATIEAPEEPVLVAAGVVGIEVICIRAINRPRNSKTLQNRPPAVFPPHHSTP
jgi:hypothetical protein